MGRTARAGGRRAAARLCSSLMRLKPSSILFTIFLLSSMSHITPAYQAAFYWVVFFSAMLFNQPPLRYLFFFPAFYSLNRPETNTEHVLSFFFLFHIQGVRRGLILFGQKQNKNRLSSAFGRGRKHSLENKKPWHLFSSILVSLIPSSTPSSIITIVTHQSLFIPLMETNKKIGFGSRLFSCILACVLEYFFYSARYY